MDRNGGPIDLSNPMIRHPLPDVTRTMNRLEIAEAVREIVRALGPDCKLAQVRNHAAEEGIEVDDKMLYRAKRKLWPDRRVNKGRPKQTPAKPAVRPAGKSAAVAGPPDDSSAAIGLLIEVVHLAKRAGGLHGLRTLVDVLGSLTAGKAVHS